MNGQWRLTAVYIELTEVADTVAMALPVQLLFVITTILTIHMIIFPFDYLYILNKILTVSS